ncbi:MAG: cell division protein FtsQ/DivIB [Pseudomonadales bacterium]|nr:cell division protein FtsQ/DivIB [Pseudomonadales bacterium]
MNLPVKKKSNSQNRKPTARAGKALKKKGASGARPKSPSALVVLRSDIRQVITGLVATINAVVQWIARHQIALIRIAGVTALVFIVQGLQNVFYSQLDDPIEHVQVSGQLDFIHEPTLKRQMETVLGQGFFSVDIDQFKFDLERLPWIDKASVRRVWPRKIEVHVIEQIPVAHWRVNGENQTERMGLLNPYGEVFAPWAVAEGSEDYLSSLPRLVGPKNQAQEVLREYADIRKTLDAQAIALQVLVVENRGAVSLTLENGVEIRLGREDVTEKLDRFVRVYQNYLRDKSEKIEMIDARYTNGIAIKWRLIEDASEVAKG